LTNHTRDQPSYPQIKGYDLNYLSRYISVCYCIFAVLLINFSETGLGYISLCITCIYLFEKVWADGVRALQGCFSAMPENRQK
jgi:hypothetical protein